MAAILVVDDDSTIRDTLYDLLSEDHLCHVAETAERALTWLATEVYDVVLTDISMPGLSGIELLSHVRQIQPLTPVIIISGIQDQGHAKGMTTLGAFDHLLKPFKLEDVEQSVARAIDHRSMLLRQKQENES
jgi:two-component system response regulator PilR (NtrC family)